MSGKIYKITGSGLTYYGSTKNALGVRRSQHKQNYKRFLEGKGNRYSAFKIIEKGDWDMELVEDMIEADELLEVEGLYIKRFPCVNKQIAGRTKQEYYKDNEVAMKAYKSQWAKDNREKIKAKYHANKVYLNAQQRERANRPGAKAKTAESDKIYRLQNKAKLDAYKKTKVMCPVCQILITKSNMSRHVKRHTE